MLNFDDLITINKSSNEVRVTIHIDDDGDLRIFYNSIWVAFIEHSEGSIRRTTLSEKDASLLEGLGIKITNAHLHTNEYNVNRL